MLIKINPMLIGFEGVKLPMKEIALPLNVEAN